MSTSYKNRLVCTVSAVASSGLGAFTVSTASSGYVTFAAGDDAKVYDIVAVEGTAWEVRTGCTYTHSGTTLSRGTLENSSTGSAIAFTTAATLTVTPSSAKFGALELAMQAVIPGGRLTLESGVPVSTSDQTAKTTVYWTPYLHNVCPLWDGVNWLPVAFAETSLAVGTVTSGLNYDIFAYLSGGSLALEKLAWTNSTTRATAITIQDGRYCKSGDKTRLYIGSFCSTSTTQTEDSNAKRYLWSMYNRVRKNGQSPLGTGHTYNSATPREWNNGSGTPPRTYFLIGLGGPVSCVVHAFVFITGSPVNGIIKPNLNGTTDISVTDTQMYIANASGGGASLSANVTAYVAAGAHYLTIFESDSSGVSGGYEKGFSGLPGFLA